jgi:hypothetical protein
VPDFFSCRDLFVPPTSGPPIIPDNNTAPVGAQH